MNQNDWNEIKQRFPISESTARRNQVAGSGDEHSSVQEPEASDLRSTQGSIPHSNARKRGKTDGVDHPKFRVTIVFNFSDDRRRDLDGAATTILDCLVATRRRLVAMDTGTELQSATSAERE